MPLQENESSKDIESLLANWQAGVASLEERRSLAAKIGDGKLSSRTSVLKKMLEDEDAIVRYNAINSLAFELNDRSAVERMLSILASDGDEDCRRVAAAALGFLFQ